MGGGCQKGGNEPRENQYPTELVKLMKKRQSMKMSSSGDLSSVYNALEKGQK